ncbi:aldehyde dehydrogenase (NADP(+)) [Olivibacter sitiensis]|uniref:aldehyde dehydrogenase (NADP(+)) n=1 Tax=Olivibacter sitiensis TaxID=376470 RepID=UPI00042470AA|nr:aldehyde dehydrogenase (NADP(+)) [Olivibacter sitiensis]
MFADTPIEKLEEVIIASKKAFDQFRELSIPKRLELMRTIAQEIEDLGQELIDTAMEESNLPQARLVGEKARTVFQWRSYADAVARGDSLQIQIDTGIVDKNPPKPDLRKTAVPLGPVVVFGASNFPFAFSTAGGDTASAIAAGCSVVVKAHPGHPKTSAIMAEAIERGIAKLHLPSAIFSHVYGASNASGTYLVQHPLVKAVAFTGSYNGGKALFDLANQRKEPIPVFSEMGSINPLFLLPEKLAEDPSILAKQYLGSLTLGTGQFCTNPGLVIAQQSASLDAFLQELKNEIISLNPMPMLHAGIAAAYAKGCKSVLKQRGVDIVGEVTESIDGKGSPLIVSTSVAQFLANPVLSHEVFGPFGLIVVAQNDEELKQVAEKLEGQLTITLSATSKDAIQNKGLIDILKGKCGRLLFNGFPTGVEVCGAMQHGGPFPATTDSRFTSVGPDAIKRFVKPLSYQNWPDELLPEELQNANPLGVWRRVNNEMTRDSIL